MRAGRRQFISCQEGCRAELKVGDQPSLGLPEEFCCDQRPGPRRRKAADYFRCSDPTDKLVVLERVAALVQRRVGVGP